MISYFHSIILGLVEGVTEFLPVSSTAHLDIVVRLLSIERTPFVSTFEIVIQLGAIAAVVVLYAPMLRRNVEAWKRIIVAFVPTGIVGFLLYKIIKTYFLGNSLLIVFTLALGGAAMIVLERVLPARLSEKPRQELETLSYKKAFVIGLAQSLAVVPGVSRSAATIMSGQIMGLSRKAIVEFSFLLAVPTMLAAAGYDLLKSSADLSASEFIILGVGFVSAYAAARISVRLLLAFVERHSFAVFGVYRIIVAALILTVLLFG